MSAAVYRAEEVAELFGLSEWSVYEAVRRQDPPIGTMAIRIGRRLVWPRASMDRLLGLEPKAAADDTPADIALTQPADEGRHRLDLIHGRVP